MVAEIPGEVIAALEAVMAGNLMHGVAADGLLYLWGAEGHHPRASVALKQQVLIGLGG